MIRIRYDGHIIISMKGIFLLTTIHLLLPFIHASLNKNKVVVAINCGSHVSYMSEDTEVNYEADKYYSTGVESALGEEYRNAWPDYQDIKLYYSERYGKDEAFNYNLPLPKINKDGHYVLVLKFSEVYFDNSGHKIFDVGIGSQVVVKGLDIYEKIGKFAPLDVFVEFDIKNGKVLYQGIEVSSAITSNDDLLVKFMKGKADNPKVNAIVLVKGNLEDTDYTEYQEFIKNKEKLGKLKEQRLQEERRVKIEGKLREEEDLDLSGFGGRLVKGTSKNVEKPHPVKEAINNFLNIPYALEAVLIGFVVFFFVIFSIVFFTFTPLGSRKEGRIKES